MPLQNRVDPFSNIHAVSARGLFVGNRGIIHDPETKTLKHQRWASESWVICTLEPRPGREKRSELMQPGHWTELFFLDEAVALAAGHRPCHGCRKEAARAFRTAVGVKLVSALNALINDEMKLYLRARAPAAREVCAPHDLPDGAFFAFESKAYLKWRGRARPFGFAGYGPAIELPKAASRLTPLATCEALAKGYAPILHPTIDSQD